MVKEACSDVEPSSSGREEKDSLPTRGTWWSVVWPSSQSALRPDSTVEDAAAISRDRLVVANASADLPPVDAGNGSSCSVLPTGDSISCGDVSRTTSAVLEPSSDSARQSSTSETGGGWRPETRSTLPSFLTPAMVEQWGVVTTAGIVAGMVYGGMREAVAAPATVVRHLSA